MDAHAQWKRLFKVVSLPSKRSVWPGETTARGIFGPNTVLKKKEKFIIVLRPP